MNIHFCDCSAGIGEPCRKSAAATVHTHLHRSQTWRGGRSGGAGPRAMTTRAAAYDSLHRAHGRQRSQTRCGIARCRRRCHRSRPRRDDRRTHVAPACTRLVLRRLRDTYMHACNACMRKCIRTHTQMHSFIHNMMQNKHTYIYNM